MDSILKRSYFTHELHVYCFLYMGFGNSNASLKGSHIILQLYYYYCHTLEQWFLTLLEAGFYTEGDPEYSP